MQRRTRSSPKYPTRHTQFRKTSRSIPQEARRPTLQNRTANRATSCGAKSFAPILTPVTSVTPDSAIWHTIFDSSTAYLTSISSVLNCGKSGWPISSRDGERDDQRCKNTIHNRPIMFAFRHPSSIPPCLKTWATCPSTNRRATF